MKKQQRPAAKQAAAKKRVPKQAPVKKAVKKKASVKKGAKQALKKKPPVKKGAKKASVKKGAKQALKKKPPVKKGAKKAPAKKAPAKKATKQQAVAKKAPAKKAPAKKAAATSSAAPAKKAAPAKATPAKKVAPAVVEAPVRTIKKGHVICELSGFEVMPGGPALAPKTVERLRLKLLDERARLHRQADELAAEADQLAHDREAGDTQFDEESGEGDTVNVERERDLLLSASARNAVEEIDEALVRIKKGTYGYCSPAGKRLSLDRLEAFPYGDVCVDCKARAERRR